MSPFDRAHDVGHNGSKKRPGGRPRIGEGESVKTKALLATALIACLLLLAGCMHGTMKVQVNADGSGQLSVTMVMEDQAASQLKSLGTEDPFAEARKNFTKLGYKVADAKTKDGSGFSATNLVMPSSNNSRCFA